MLNIPVYKLPTLAPCSKVAVHVTWSPGSRVLGVHVPTAVMLFIFALNVLMLMTPGWVSLSDTISCELLPISVYATSTQANPPYVVHWNGIVFLGIDVNANRSARTIAITKNANEYVEMNSMADCDLPFPLQCIIYCKTDNLY